MRQRIKDYIVQQGLIESGDVVIAAVSGGADSVCMLHILCELKEELNISLRALHVEHGIRGEASFADAEFTKGLCETLKVPIETVNVDVPAYAKAKGLGEEEAARELRYDALKKSAMKNSAKIALAHHMEDNAETVIFQLLRGSGIKGLTGISSIRKEDAVYYIRPLLAVQRSDIEKYLEDINQGYCVDATNLENKYSRNRLRNEVFPEFEKINLKAVEHINNTAAQLSVAYDYLEEQAKVECEKIARVEEDSICFSVDSFLRIHSAIKGIVILQLLELVCKSRKDITSVHVDDVIMLVTKQSGKRVNLPYGVEAIRQHDEIVIKRRGLSDGEKSVFIEVGETELESANSSSLVYDLFDGKKLEIRIFEYDGDSEKIPKKPYTKWVDYDKIKNGFQIRTRRPGDYFVNGALGHKKKLKQYFIDQKIPSEMRDEIILIAKDDEIACIMGGRIGEGYKVLDGSKRVVEFFYNGG